MMPALAACSDGGNGAANKPIVVPAATPAVAPDADARLIVAFGDSLYAGYGLSQRDGFVPHLERALKAAGLSVRVFNAGVSGDTTAGGLARIGFVLDGLPKKPDLVLVGLGGNDMLRGLTPAITRANLQGILAELERRRIPAMLTGMLAAPNLGPDYGRQFNAIYPDLARRHHAALYPFFLADVVGNAQLMQADTIHPNARGVAIIVGKIAPVVEAALARQRAG